MTAARAARSIRRSLIARLLVVLVGLAVAIDAALYVYLRGELVEQYDGALQAEARAIGSAWQPDAPATAEAARINATFRHLRFGRAGGDVVEIVRSADDAVMLRLPPGDGRLKRVGPRLPPGGRRRAYNLALPDGRSGRATEIAIDPRGENPATTATGAQAEFSIVLAEDREEIDGTLATLAMGLFAIGGGVSAASVWLVVATVGRALRPLHDFSESVGRLDADSLAYRFPIDALPDELRPISARLNDLLARLDAAFGRERRFSDNVAHELRTPLAELRSMVEVAMRWPPEPDAFAAHHAGLLDVVVRMTSVVQNLLTLIRSDGSKLVANLAPVDLVASAHAAWASHERTATRRNVGVAFDAPATLDVPADAALLSSLLDNLFANAATYATPSGTVRCAIRDDGGATFELTNAVVDLNAADLARLEEPFWRKDAARGGGDHAGLGLSLVREYARALGITCEYSIPRPGAFTVELRWPTPLPNPASSPDASPAPAC